MNKMQIYLILRVCSRTCEYASYPPARDTTLVAISQSGKTGDMLRAAESYSGADIVSITNHARSSLAALAGRTILLPCAVRAPAATAAVGAVREAAACVPAVLVVDYANLCQFRSAGPTVLTPTAGVRRGCRQCRRLCRLCRLWRVSGALMGTITGQPSKKQHFWSITS